MSQTLDLEPYKALIKTLVARTGPMICDYFHGVLQVESKSDATPVTEADRQAEIIMRDLIQAEFPSHGILGEEYGWHQQGAEWCWVLDPVDGTKSFIAGSYDFGTIIGLTYQGQPVLGAIYQPVLQELFLGDNETATCNGKLLRVAKDVPLSEAILLASDFARVECHHGQAGLLALSQAVKYTRTWGNCFGYSLVAKGTPAVMLDPLAAPWDSMGVIPIIRGAGGEMCSFIGGSPVNEASVFACPPAWQAEVIALLASR